MSKISSTPLDIVGILQVCRDIEVCCAEIYRVYEERFADDAELQTLWAKTRAEEENHARQFALAINMRREGVVVSTSIDKVKATVVLAMLKSIYDGILLHTPTRLDALRSAIKLEEKLAAFHLEAVASFQDDSLRKMFQSMMRADNLHLKALEDMFKLRLGDEDR